MSSVHTCRTWWAGAVSDLDLTQKSAPEVHVILVKLTQMLNISHIKTLDHVTPPPPQILPSMKSNIILASTFCCDVNEWIIGRID